MKISLARSKRYKLVLSSGLVLEGITRFYHHPDDNRPIVLITDDGEVQIASDSVVTCVELKDSH